MHLVIYELEQETFARIFCLFGKQQKFCSIWKKSENEIPSISLIVIVIRFNDFRLIMM